MRPDRVLYLLTAIVSLLGVAPVIPFLDLPVQLLVGAALAGGFLCRRTGRYLPNGPATVLTLAGVGFYLLQLRLDAPVLPLVQALALLLALRQLTVPTPRHLLQTLILSLILLSASSLLSLSPVFFPLLIMLVLLVSLALVLLCALRFQPDLELPRPLARRFLRVALALPLGSLVLMLLFYVVLPRSNTPLWHGLNPQAPAVTGYSDTVAPGTAPAVIDSEQVVLRVESPLVAVGQLYWRGAVFRDFDGQQWQRVNGPGPVERVQGGEAVRQRVFLQPGQYPVLFTLDRPLAVTGLRLRELAGRSYAVSRRQYGQRFSYEVEARPGARLLAPPPAPEAPERDVPEQVAPRLRQLVRSWPVPASPAAALAQVEDFFRSQRLRYATSGLPRGAFPLDVFLLDVKAGHCEFFASSFALLLRLRGVPARLVGGYLGGEYNALGGYYLVRQAMAHVWVEAYLPEEGWVRIDPSTLAVNAGEVLLARRTGGLPLTTLILDSLNYAWVRLVVTYDLQQQIKMARGLRQTLAGWRLPGVPSGWWLLAAGGVAGMIGAAAVWYRRRRLSDTARLFRRFCRRVGWTQETLPPAAGLLQLADGCPDPWGRAFLQRLSRTVFAGDDVAGARRELEQLLARVPRRRLTPPSPGTT